MDAQIEPTKDEKLSLLQQKLKAMMDKKKEKLQSKANATPTASQPVASEAPQKQVPKPVQTHIEKDEAKGDSDHEPTQTANEPPRIKKIKKPRPETKVTLRKAAGCVWEDKTMEDWDESDYRVFCGNLGNEVTDEVLATVFRKYPSFQKARIVRDKRTGKTRGYGFVSFRNPKDFLACLSEMQGQYVGNRPVRLKKSSWKERKLDSEKNQLLPSDFRRHAKKKTSQINTNFMFTGVL